MSDPNKSVFISYDRRSGAYVARAIYQDLRDHEYDVFMDYESIDAGTFDTIVLNQIAARAHFIIVLAPGAAEKLADPDSWFRQEIEHALDLERNIVPVLINDFHFDDYPAAFTGKLADLPRLNALAAPIDYFAEAMQVLRNRFLHLPVVEPTLVPTPLQEQVVAAHRVEAAMRGAADDLEKILQSDPARYSIFMSYRRSDNPYAAGHIYDRLTAHFGRGDVFKDVDDIPAGVDFREHLADVINKCAVMLVIAGPGWLDATDEQGARRLENPADYVRLEVEAGLGRYISVIPVFLQGVSSLNSDALPLSLRPLAYRHAIPVRPDPDFDRDIARLIRALESILEPA